MITGIDLLNKGKAYVLMSSRSIKKVCDRNGSLMVLLMAAGGGLVTVLAVCKI